MRQAKPSLFISLSFHCSESLIGNLQNFYSMHNLTLQAVGKKSVDFFFLMEIKGRALLFIMNNP